MLSKLLLIRIKSCICFAFPALFLICCSCHRYSFVFSLSVSLFCFCYLAQASFFSSLLAIHIRSSFDSSQSLLIRMYSCILLSVLRPDLQPDHIVNGMLYLSSFACCTILVGIIVRKPKRLASLSVRLVRTERRSPLNHFHEQ